MMDEWDDGFSVIKGSGFARDERRPTAPSEPPRKPPSTVVIPAGNAHTTLTRTVEVPDPAPADDIAQFAEQLRVKHDRKQKDRANNRRRRRLERQRAGYE